MPRPPAEDLETFLQRQDLATLVALLLELAEDHEAVRERLARLRLADRPDKLAAGFRKTLNGWRRSSKFVAGREAREFGRALEGWLDQVGRELMPKDPAAALALFEAFIESDDRFFERADDSDGAIGDAVRAACRWWLQAAAQCETPASQWPARLIRLASADEYGAREELLGRADLLMDEAGLRGLVAQFESRMAQALQPRAAGEPPSTEVFRASAALSLLAEELHDPDVKVRAVLACSPQPNATQREDFVEAYLKADRAADALKWLDGPWGHLEDSRQRLRARALESLGRFDESVPIREKLFEQTLAVYALHGWLAHLPEASRAAATARAKQLALDHDDPARAAALLLEVDDDAGAEAVLLAEPARIDGDDYGTLVPLAKSLHARELWRGETAVYRALLTAILERAYARAYGHAARYWARLGEIAAMGVDLQPLAPHADFEAAVRARHARKTSFWAHVKGKTRDDVDDSDG